MAIPRRRRRLLPFAAAALALATGPTRAQPDPAPPLDAKAILSIIGNTYRAGPTSERVIITVHRPPIAGGSGGGSDRRDEAIIRIDPGRAIDAAGARLYLELGDLRIAASAGRITAIHTQDPGTYVQQEYTEPLTPAVLARLLPPLPLPQIDLALTAADPPTHLTPYLDTIVWDDAVALDSADAPTRATLTGRSADRRIQLVADMSGRLREFTADLLSHSQREGTGVGSSSGPTLHLRCTPLDLAADSTWTTSTDGRTRVAALADLRARPGDLKPGDTVPNFALSLADGRAWSLAEDLSPLEGGAGVPPASDPGGAGVPPASLPQRPCLILLLVRQPTDPAAALRRPTDPDLAPAVEAITSLLRAQELSRAVPLAARPPPVPVGGARCAYRPALIFDLTTKDLPARIQAALGDPATAPDAKPTGWGKRLLLWTTSAATTIDRLAPGVDTAIAIIDADRVLRAVIPVPAAVPRDALRADLDAALAPTVPEPREP